MGWLGSGLPGGAAMIVSTRRPIFAVFPMRGRARLFPRDGMPTSSR